MKQTLTQRVILIERQIEILDRRICNLENPTKLPYTAMRSTGEYCTCVHIGEPNSNKCVTCYKPIKPQEDVREKIYEELVPYMTQGAAFGLSERILAIVKGE